MRQTFIRFKTGDIAVSHIREMYEELYQNDFKLMKWSPRDALIEKKRDSCWLYTGQKFDPDYIELIKGGWTHDHCQICDISISDTDGDEVTSEGYFDNYDWVCRSCYESVLSTDNIEGFIRKSEKAEL